MKLLTKLIRFTYKSVIFIFRLIITVILSDDLDKYIDKKRKKDRDDNYYYFNGKYRD
jgi:hypothetical protein